MVKFTLEEAMKAQRGVQVSLYSFFNLGTRWVWVILLKYIFEKLYLLYGIVNVFFFNDCISVTCNW